MRAIRPIKSGLARSTQRILGSFGYQCDIPTLVIESDDWGAVRVPSKSALKAYLDKFPDAELDQYQLFDTLDSADDVEMLQDVLCRHRGMNNCSPIATLNFAMANPLFENNNEVLGQNFLWEPVTETYRRVYGSRKTSVDVISSQGINGVLRPQLHGREHLNVTAWRRGISEQSRLRFAYKLQMPGLNGGRYCAIDALNRANTEIDHSKYLSDAQELFMTTFGFASKSFIPPCYVISSSEEKFLPSLGIRCLQTKMRTNRSNQSGKLFGVPTIIGHSKKSHLSKSVRNCQFEPSMWMLRGVSSEECVARGLRYIADAFKAHQPAVVCSHRVNYVGGIDKDNRAKCLGCLDVLLGQVVKEWPEVRFMSSDQLGELMWEESYAE